MAKKFMRLQRFSAVPKGLLTVALLCSAAGLPAETVTLTPSADTSMFEFAPLNNLGGMMTLAAGRTASRGPARALIKFDITNAVPAGAQIVAARVRVVVVKANFFPQPSTFVLHRVLVDWGEGDNGTGDASGSGSLAAEGEATWRAGFHPATMWSTPGLGAGSDYVEAASSSVGIDLPDAYDFDSTTSLVADVQGWLDNPASNFGWLLRSEAEASVSSTARRFASRESAADVPSLEIEYTLEAPLRIAGAQQESGEFRLSFLAEAGFTYTVEYRDSVASGNWSALTNVTAKMVNIDAVAIDSLAASQRFYRLSRVPCNCD
jgi:hypothetical protein